MGSDSAFTNTSYTFGSLLTSTKLTQMQANFAANTQQDSGSPYYTFVGSMSVPGGDAGETQASSLQLDSSMKWTNKICYNAYVISYGAGCAFPDMRPGVLGRTTKTGSYDLVNAASATGSYGVGYTFDVPTDANSYYLFGQKAEPFVITDTKTSIGNLQFTDGDDNEFNVTLYTDDQDDLYVDFTRTGAGDHSMGVAFGLYLFPMTQSGSGDTLS